MQKIFKIEVALRYVLFFTLLIGISNSCDQQLDLKPLTETEADYFKEVIDFERAAIGIYAKMSDFYWYNSGNSIHSFWLLPGDDLTSYGSGGLGKFDFEVFATLIPQNEPIRTYYKAAYELINRSNILLQKIQEDEDATDPVFTKTADRDILKGEALFLRGFMNFQLWNYFGTSPNITERITTQNAIYPSNAEENELLDQAVLDFDEASKLLPASWDDADRGRVTKSSAYGYKGKALVFKACATQNNDYYTQAMAAFEKISDKSLVDNYGDNFSVQDENNSESLFEYQAAEAGYDNVWLSNDFPNQAIGSYSAYYGYFNNHWSWPPHMPIIATQKLMQTIEPEDPRLPYILDTASGFIRKYLINTAISSSGVSTLNNPRLLRYADILLLWAEALNETGDPGGAIEKINHVRARARNMGSTGIPADHPSITDQEEVRIWIQEERFVELAAEEGHRWLDLRRWHMAGWLDLENWDFSSVRSSFHIEMDKHLQWPIPLGETDLNENIIQNPGY